MSRDGKWMKGCVGCGKPFSTAAGSQRAKCDDCTPVKILTPAQRRVLEKLRDAEDRAEQAADPYSYPEYEIVCEGIQCYIGLERTTWAVVNALLRIMAISDTTSNGESYHRYSINETGRNVLLDESQILSIREALAEGGAWTWENGKFVRMT
jgi:hypothetical protein